MRVFRQLLVVGVSGAITLTNMGRGIATSVPGESSDNSSSQPLGLVEHSFLLSPAPLAAVVEEKVSPSEGQTAEISLSHQDLNVDNQHIKESREICFSLAPTALAAHRETHLKSDLETSSWIAQTNFEGETEVAPITPPPDTNRVPAATEPITELYPQPAPSGTLETNPPPIIEPHPNPLRFPTQPSEVRIEETLAITLEQAIDLARRNNHDLQVAELQVEQGREGVREQQGALWPQLSLQSVLQRADSAAGQLQRNAQNRQIRRRQNDGVEGLSEDFTSLGINQFNNTLQVTYNLGIDGGRAAQIRATQETLRLRELDYERIAEQVRFDVTTAYYTLQEADSRVVIAEAAVENAQKSLQDAEALERAGVGTRFSVLQAQVQLANEQQLLSQAVSSQRTARRRLAEELNINESVNLTAADPVQEAGIWNPSLEESIILAFKNRAELEQQLVDRDRNRALRDAALATIRPQVTVFANYNVLGQFPDDGDPFAARGWADGYAVGAQLQWNFFDGGTAKARARQREIDGQIAETRFSQTRNQVRLEVEQAYFQLESSFENISTAKLGLEQAEEALRLARLRFQAGVGTQTDVINQETELTRARSNLVQAIIGYNQALSSLHRAVSNLPGSNLSNRP